MVNYVCPRCNKNFNRKSSYDVHMNRKNKCDVIKIDNSEKNTNKYSLDTKKYPKKYNCDFCDKVLSNNSNYHKHLKICKMKISKEKDNNLKEELLTLLIEIKEENKKQQSSYEKQIDNLQNEIRKQSDEIKK